jgi:hypothetical protein
VIKGMQTKILNRISDISSKLDFELVINEVAYGIGTAFIMNDFEVIVSFKFNFEEVSFNMNFFNGKDKPCEGCNDIKDMRQSNTGYNEKDKLNILFDKISTYLSDYRKKLPKGKS